MSSVRVLRGRNRRGVGLSRTARVLLVAAAVLAALVFLICGGCGGGDKGTKPNDLPPAINGVMLDPRRVAPGDTVSATVVAGDPEGKPLTFLWRVNAGMLLDSLSTEAVWVAPTHAATCSLTVLASDGAEQSSFVTEVPVGIGVLTVESYPQAATVYFDEEPTVHVTPVTIDPAPCGAYSIRVVQSGFAYYPASRSVTVTNGNTTTVTFVLNQSGMTLTQLTARPSDCAVETSWSPDGTRLACAVENTIVGYRKIMKFQWPWPDATGEYLETKDAPDWGPSWGVGNVIAFASSRGGAVPRIYSVSADGGVPQMVYTNEANFPAWSWDGQQIAFVANNAGLHELTVWRPYTLPETVVLDVVEDRPAWKPDNSEIAFSKLVGGEPYIFTVSMTGGPTVTQVSHVPGTHPQWSPDGSKIAFVSSFGGTTGVWILFLDRGPEPLDGWLTTSGEDWPTWRPGSGYLCFTAAPSGGCRAVWMAQNYPF